MRKQIIYLAILSFLSICVYAQTTPVTTRYGALAIDKSNGFYYGFSYDYISLADAQAKAIKECKAKGGNCVLVLCWSGTGCGVYRTIEGESVGTAYGWGVAKTKAEADNIATMECTQRSNGEPALNHAFSCNSSNSGALKVIYNAGTSNNSTVNANAAAKPAPSPANEKTANDLPLDVYLNGFTNKAEAENKTVNGKKEGKWYEMKTVSYGDVSYPTEYLTVYKNGITRAEKVYVKGFLYSELFFPTQSLKAKDDEIVQVFKEYSKGRLYMQYIDYGNTINGKRVVKTFRNSGITEVETIFPNGTKTMATYKAGEEPKD